MAPARLPPPELVARPLAAAMSLERLLVHHGWVAKSHLAQVLAKVGRSLVVFVVPALTRMARQGRVTVEGQVVKSGAWRVNPQTDVRVDDRSVFAPDGPFIRDPARPPMAVLYHKTASEVVARVGRDAAVSMYARLERAFPNEHSLLVPCVRLFVIQLPLDRPPRRTASGTAPRASSSSSPRPTLPGTCARAFHYDSNSGRTLQYVSIQRDSRLCLALSQPPPPPAPG